MSPRPKQIFSLCPACSECPSVEVYDDTVRIGEAPNLAMLRHEEWNELVKAIKSGQLAEIGG